MKCQVDGASQFNTIEIELSKMYGCLLEISWRKKTHAIGRASVAM